MTAIYLDNPIGWIPRGTLVEIHRDELTDGDHVVANGNPVLDPETCELVLAEARERGRVL